jgi:phosphatidylinositol-bisphosphatase
VPNGTAPPPPASTPKPPPSKRPSIEQSPLVTRTPDEEAEDGRIRNREAVTKIRDAWIYKQIRARQDEFTQYKQARLFVGSFNVNAKGKDETLEPWLCADWGTNGENAPDIVAVGFQEIVDLNAMNVTVDNKSQQRAQYWTDKIARTLNAPHLTRNDPNRGYALLMKTYMVGLLVCVFVKNPHKPRVKYVVESTVGVGVMGMLGNKGGVSIRLQFYDSSMCFVCTHLAAHRENVVGRNADFANVYNKTTFDIGEEAIREVIRSGSLSQWATGTSMVGVADHDLVFWFGDLNYRIDESMGTEQVLQFSEKGLIGELRDLDQLNIERKEGRVFEGFEEGFLTFPPTYKYQPGTEMYEQRPDKKLRAPAWCDRVLWMAQEPSHVHQLTYNRSEIPNMSDHKAVYSTMRLTIKDVIPARREAVYGEVMRLLDKFENQTLPMVGFDRTSLDFGALRWGDSVTLPIQITNTGKVVAQFRFVPKLDELVLCKPWMTVSPTFGMLIPGEPPATINFTLNVDNVIANLINAGREVLEDILILRLENGRDYYITIKGTYARSCFGMAVDDLVMYTEPIRNVPLDPIKRSEKYDPNPSAALCVPKELWRIVDALYERGLQEPDLFLTPGYEEEVKMIRECLDTGAPFGRFHVHSMAEVMVSFLSNLSSTIVPPTLFPVLEIDSQNIQSFSRRFLEELPPIHYNVFVYVISFFREALLYRETNKLSAAKVARICCNSMVVGANNILDDSSQSMQRRAGMQLIILHLLETNSI